MSWAGIAGAVALVTGAGQGIGAAVARTLAAHGAAVAVLDSSADRAAKVARDATAAGGRALAAPADVRRPGEVEAALELVERELGPIRILVNAAGVLRPGAVVDSSDDDWSTTFDVNATGVFVVSRAVARRMVPLRAGTIVTIGSNAAGVPRTDMAAYAASKAAATTFTKCLGLELAQHGIRCNVVSPGSTDTPMQRALWTDGSGVERVIAGVPEKFRVGIPLRKLARPEDVANAVLYLVSDLAGHITMHDLYVDGGATLRG